MSPVAGIDWQTANQRYLKAALDVVAHTLERHVDGAPGEPPVEALAALEEAEARLPAPAALQSVCAAFELSAFERDVLLLCAGVETQGWRIPTFSLALAALPGAYWSAISPAAPLRYWRLVEVGAGETLLTSPLRIDERILHYLTGTSYLDVRLQPTARLLTAPGILTPSHRAAADRLARLWAAGGVSGPQVQLCGPEVEGKRMVAAAAAATLGVELHVVKPSDLPQHPADREAAARLWEREAALTGCALLLDCEESDSGAAAFADLCGAPLLIAAPEPVRLGRRESVRIDVSKPSPSEQRMLWDSLLGPAVRRMDRELDALAAHFNLSLTAIQNAAALVQAEPMPRLLAARQQRLWEACRVQARPRMDDLAHRVEPAAVWDDLVLPAPQSETLREITAQVRNRARVYGQWGFGARQSRGLGISALFAGGSGTGKTLAAEVIAGVLELDLYRIDLSQVVSKYIGETEKNLRRVFDAAEEGGAVLLFDEADALFGKRTEVKDSHDRYANIEVGYLLQRMEAYHGLAVLTTNMKQALDPAFLRRIRFVVQFPFPEAAQRAEIWRRAFPPGTPTVGLDFDKLAQLNVAGGNIRNIALGAAFLAAEAGGPVSMGHLLRAARTEYAKLEKALSAAEIRGWA